MSAPISVSVNQPVLDTLKAKLAAARDGLKNDGPAMRQVAVYLDQWVQRNFKGQGSNVGNWVPFTYGGRLALKDASKSKAKKKMMQANAQSIDGHRWINTSAQLLQDTGALRLSFLPFVRKGLAGIGSDLPYSKPHEDGEGVPQRRMLPKNAEVETPVFSILENFVTVQLRKAQ